MQNTFNEDEREHLTRNRISSPRKSEGRVADSVLPETPTVRRASQTASSRPKKAGASSQNADSGRRKGARRWSQRVAPEAEERLREHPVFSPTLFSDGFGSIALRETDREPFFARELLRMFKGRVQLVASIGFCFVPIFTAFYYWLSPVVAPRIALVQCCLFGLLAAFYVFVKHARSLAFLRVCVQIGFAFFAFGTAHLITIATGDSAQLGEIGRAVQFVVLASFIHILLAILLLPFTLREALCATFIAIGAMAWGLYLSLPFGRSATYIAQIFVVASTAALIITLSHLNARLRRRAFDSAFDLALQAARMQEMSQTDTLTGSFNRRHLEQILTTELARAARFNHEVSVLMFDLDNFKPVNDTLGHGAGDEVLKIVARAVAAKMREVDSFGRFGGDEFVVVLPETGRKSAITMANRLRASVASQLWSECGPDSLAAKITLSMGVITLAGPVLPLAGEVLERVDNLLYDAKRQGKDCVVYD